MVLLGSNKIRSDVFDEGLDERLAPSLGGVVLGKEPDIYGDPAKFFSLTLITQQMIDILDDITDVLVEGKGRKVVLLSALYGGGKTHTLITIYHALRNSNQLVKAAAEEVGAREKVQKVVNRISSIVQSTDVIVVDGYMQQLAPHPVAPLGVGAYSVRTLWGYIAHCLGSYSLLKVYDEQLVAPEVDTLIKLFENRRVVILVDELANYIQSILSQTSYVSALKSFIERLVKAVDIAKNVVLVVSVPVAIGGRGEVERVETTYIAIRDAIEAIVKSLSRVAVMYVEPVSPRNVPALLRVRLFESVDRHKASEMRKALYSNYSRDGEVFDRGLAEGVAQKIVDTYPFHPTYIDTLIDILDKHVKLQKTRDLLKISRRILRSVASGKESYELVMPWHINLVSDEVLASYLMQGFEGFRSVIKSDVQERAGSYEKLWLAQIVANTLLVRTFVYGGGLVPKHEVFPTPEELAVMVYEPKSFSDRGLLPKDVVDAVDWMKHNLVYVLEDEKTRRLWFTQFITPVKYVEDRAKHVSDLDVIKEIEASAKNVLKTRIESKKKSTVEVGKIFDRELSTVSYSCDKLDYDAPKYILYACVDVPSNPTSRQPVFEEIIYTTKSGGPRRHANTIFVAFPSSKERTVAIFDLVRKHKACREVEAEGHVEKLVSDYTVEEREIVKKVLENKLKEYCSKTYSDMLMSILSLFNSVAYPAYVEGRNTVKEADLSIMDTVVEGVEHALQSIQPRKIVLDMDFETLDYYLRGVGIDLTEVSAPKSVRDIIGYFYSNPRLPVAREDTIKRAIAGGLNNLSIGLLCRDNVYFKVIEACKTDEECRRVVVAKAEIPPVIADECQVLSWREALIEQLRRLKSVAEGLKIIEYLVRYGEELYRVEDVVESIEKFDIDVLRNAPLLKRERTAVIKIYPERKEVTVEPGGSVELGFTVERLGNFVGEISIQSSSGEISPSKAVFNADVPRNEFVWKYRASLTDGTSQELIRLLLPDGTEVARAVVIVSVSVVPADVTKCVKGLPKIYDRSVKEVRVKIDRPYLKPLQIINARFRGFNIGGKLELVLRRDKRDEKSTRVILEFDEVAPDEAYKIVGSIINALQLGEVKLSIRLSLKATEIKPLPQLLENEFNELSQYVTEVCFD
ncbi:MAG: DUF499 domain-containing protein [Sulfolobales archaeon]